MSLFEAAVAQVIKDVGDQTLIPVPDRNSADYCKIMSVIERKTSFRHLPWNSSEKYLTTEIGLNDLLEEPVDVASLVTSTVLFEKYESTPSFNRNGKIGGKIAEEFDVDISMNETLEVSLKLGNVIKNEIPWQLLYDTVNKKKVKMDHPLIKVVKKSKSKSLFVINMIVISGLQSSIDKETKVDGDIGAGVDFTPKVALHLNASGSSDLKQHRQYSIPNGTSFGYCCFQLKIDKNGVLNLQLGEDVIDAPPDCGHENSDTCSSQQTDI